MSDTVMQEPTTTTTTPTGDPPAPAPTAAPEATVPVKALEAERKARQAAEAKIAELAEQAKAADELRKALDERDKREAARTEAVTKRAQDRLATLPEALRALAPKHLAGDDLADWVDAAAAQAAVLAKTQAPAMTPGRAQGEGGPDEPTEEEREWARAYGYENAAPATIKRAFRKLANTKPRPAA